MAKSKSLPGRRRTTILPAEWGPRANTRDREAHEPLVREMHIQQVAQQILLTQCREVNMTTIDDEDWALMVGRVFPQATTFVDVCERRLRKITGV